MAEHVEGDLVRDADTGAIYSFIRDGWESAGTKSRRTYLCRTIFPFEDEGRLKSLSVYDNLVWISEMEAIAWLAS